MAERIPQFGALRDLLADLYDDEADAKRIVRDIGLRTSVIVWHENMQNIWDAILTEAELQNTMPRLFDVVTTPPRDSLSLLRLIDDYSLATGIARSERVPYPLPQKPPRVPSLPLMSNSQRSKMGEWLGQHGFPENPFSRQVAEHEKRLPEYFVFTPFYDDIMGSATGLQSMVIAAGRGCGLSAHRLMVAHTCRPLNKDSVNLAVEYPLLGSFQVITGGDAQERMLQQHRRPLIRTTLDAFVRTMNQSNGLTKRTRELNWGRLKWFCQTYGTKIDQLSLSGWDDVPPDSLSENSPIGVLYESLVKLIQSAGIGTVYVLFDRTTESHTLARNPERVARIIGPLIAELPLMDIPGAAFRFFVPLEIAHALQDYPGVWTDRVLFRELYWTDDMMSELLAQRLATYSATKVTAMGQLCESQELAAEFETGLVRAAQGIPRNLLRAAEALIMMHCLYRVDQRFLQREDWEALGLAKMYKIM